MTTIKIHDGTVFQPLGGAGEEGRVAIEGQPGDTVPVGGAANPLVLAPGNGVSFTADPAQRRIRVHAQQAPALLSLDHFHPGQLPADATLLRTFDLGGMASRSFQLRTVEAHLLTPPSDVASGVYGIEVAGSESGSVELPFDVDGQQGFSLATQPPVSLGDSASGSTFGPNASTVGWCIATTRIDGQPMEITAIAPRGTISLSAGVKRRFGILDRTGRWLSYVDTTQGFNGGDSDVLVLPYPVSVGAGEIFLMGSIAPDWQPGQGGLLGQSDRAGGYDQLALANIADYVDNGTARGAATVYGAQIDKNSLAPAGVTLFDALNSPDADAAASYHTTLAGQGGYGPVTGSSGLPPMEIFGRPTGVELIGDVRVSVATTGTPSVTPADVNIRLDGIVQG